MSFDPLATLTEQQRETLADYEALLADFNGKVNLISRPSEARIRTEHTLHSLALARRAFPGGAQVVDWGTGGGLPAIPLAVCFPRVQFFAVDANGTKIRAVRAMARRLGLENLTAEQSRAEEWAGRAGWSVTRATAPLVDLWRWHRRAFEPPAARAEATPGDAPGEEAWRPGLLALKGGDLTAEKAALQEAFPGARVERHPLQALLGRDFFTDKYIVAVQQRSD